MCSLLLLLFLLLLLDQADQARTTVGHAQLICVYPRVLHLRLRLCFLRTVVNFKPRPSHC